MISFVLKLTVTFWEKGRGDSVHVNQDFWVIVTAEARLFEEKSIEIKVAGLSMNRLANHLG